MDAFACNHTWQPHCYWEAERATAALCSAYAPSRPRSLVPKRTKSASYDGRECVRTPAMHETRLRATQWGPMCMKLAFVRRKIRPNALVPFLFCIIFRQQLVERRFICKIFRAAASRFQKYVARRRVSCKCGSVASHEGEFHARSKPIRGGMRRAEPR